MLFEGPKTHDIFISYVIEDRELVNEIYNKLTEHGLRVWYAKKEFEPGDNIADRIYEGLKNNRLGIALITHNYNSYWAHVELEELKRKNKKFVPILYNITIEEVTAEKPDLLHRWAVVETNIDTIISEIVKKIEPKPAVYYNCAFGLHFIKKKKIFIRNLFIVLGLFYLLALFLSHRQSLQPSKTEINQVVEKRKGEMDALVKNHFQEVLVLKNGKLSTLEAINQKQQGLYFQHTITSHRNHYNFYNGMEHIQSLTGLKSNGIISNTSLAEAPFGLLQYRPYIFKQENDSSLLYSLINIEPVQYEIVGKRIGNGLCEIDIAYTQFLRCAEINLKLSPSNHRQNRTVTLLGFKPQETLVFEKKGSYWFLQQIR